ncbi:MAG: beta-lactamase family protein [Pseudomonadales bacterium]|nr:beta-lactamase family protein [Pseudomonadales bacterium]
MVALSNLPMGGFCDAQFLRVQQQFEKNMNSGSELGSAVSIVQHGKLVVDLWAGYSDKKATIPWEKDSIVNVFSSTKGVAALCIQHALDAGLLDLEKKVTYFWPEFGQKGKRDTIFSWLLSHRAGVPALRDPVPDYALFDWDYMVTRFAEERPWWEPGVDHGYHMVSGGWMMGEVFRRALGCSIDEYLQTEIISKLDVDFYIGVPEEAMSRVAQLKSSFSVPENGRVFLFDKITADRGGALAKALMNPQSLMTSSNRDEWKRMELPSATGHGSARGLATLYGAAVGEGAFLSRRAISRCSEVASDGLDKVLDIQTRFGPGFLLQQQDNLETGFGSGARAFGHPGSGGSLGFADPEKEIGFGYVMNQMGSYLMVDPRARSLVEAMYQSLEV